MKKKLLAISLIMALLLAGCGSDDSAKIAGEISALPPTQAPTAAATDPVETEPPVEEHDLSLGRVEGGTYTNTYAGFGCTMDDTWTFYSAEELQQLPAAVADALEGSALSEYMENAQQMTDMMAENVELLCTVNVLFQKVSLQDRLAFAALGEEEMIAQTIAQQGDVLISSYAQMGIEITTMEKKTVTFLGEERTALYSAGTQEGIPVFFLQLMDYSRGSYSVTTTFCSYLEDKTEQQLDLFFVV